MGASHSSEPDVIAKEDIEPNPPELEEDSEEEESEEENPYDVKEEPMDWFWPFV